MTDYMSCTETAALVRAALKNAYPGIKFSVRSTTYAGGARIDIGWTDGPQRTAVDTVVQPYAGAGFDGTTDLKTINCHWLHPDGRPESFQSQIGHSWAQRTIGGDGTEVPAEYARDYRHGVASVTGEQLAGPAPDTTSPAYQQGQDDARKRLADGARLVHFGADSIFTARAFSDEYRGQLEREVAFLAGEAGPFDGNRRYGFGLTTGGRWFEGSGTTLARQLSEAGDDEVKEALASEAKRRAVAAAARFNDEHAEDDSAFYVTVREAGHAGTLRTTVKDAGRFGLLLGPYSAREDAEADVNLGRRLAQTVNDRAIWYAYGAARLTRTPGKELPAGILEHLVERQMALAALEPAPR